MEDYVYVIISIAFMTCSLIAIKMLKGETGPKRAKKEVQDSALKEVVYSKDLTITTLKDELRSVKGKLYRNMQLEPDQEEETPTNQGKQVTFDQITALVNTQYPQYAKLLPLVKKQVMDATKGMTMEEILQYVKQFTGNKQSSGLPSISPSTQNPNWA